MKEWIVGRNPVFETLRAHRREIFRLWIASGVEERGRVGEIMDLAVKRRVQPARVLRSQTDGLGDNAQGVAVEVSGYPYVDLLDILDIAHQKQEPIFALLLDQIQNPQNLGTIIRTAEAVGVHGIVMPSARSVGVTPAVVSASAGATEHLHIAQYNLAQAISVLKEAGTWIIGLDGGPAAQPVEKVPLSGPVAIVVGSEGEGIRSLVRTSCDFLLRLPMVGKIESLNASVAGSIVLYLAHWARTKQE